MGDRIQMEIRKRRTLTGLFIKYICIYSVSTILLVLLMLFVFNLLVNMGVVLPANYMERQINENENKIVSSERVKEDLLPAGSFYGVYSISGDFLYGNLKKDEYGPAWQAYESNNTFADGGGIYRFLLRNNEEVCIVKYKIKSQATNEFLRNHFPSPDFCILILFFALFLLQTILISRHFARSIAKRLKVLGEVTEKIRCHDLEIGDTHSDIREIDQVLVSLSSMGKALKESLNEQWTMEKQKKEQIAALAHDIKTPLTVIKGNAELLSEEALKPSGREYTGYIRENAAEIENYLLLLQDMILSEDTRAQETMIFATELADQLISRAETLASGYSAGQISVEVKKSPFLSGEISCDIRQIKRAWDNILGNALEYTLEADRLQEGAPGICLPILITMEKTEHLGESYLAAGITDRGDGFTEEDLIHAASQFYQGDKSRHKKIHRGLGLYTASSFAVRQGGRLLLENSQEEDYGARVTLMLKLKV